MFIQGYPGFVPVEAADLALLSTFQLFSSDISAFLQLSTAPCYQVLLKIHIL